MLAMYAGLGLSLVLADSVVLLLVHGHIRAAFLPSGIRAAVPVTAFWAVAGLRSAVAAPVDRRGTWLFRSVLGRPASDHFAGRRVWITLVAALLSSAIALLLFPLSPASMQTGRVLCAQLIIALGSSLVLADVFLHSTHSLPFSQIHKSTITDFPLMVLRYFVLFPVFVSLTVHLETWAELSTIHLVKIALLFAAAHAVLRAVHAHSLRQFTNDTGTGEDEEFPQNLGLRDF
jgi:hypothetical protein